jgi:hypothetical protein
VSGIKESKAGLRAVQFLSEKNVESTGGLISEIFSTLKKKCQMTKYLEISP